MRIEKTYDKFHDCDLRTCGRNYCGTHRLLYRDCDSMERGWEGDRDVINGTRMIWEVTGECPRENGGRYV